MNPETTMIYTSCLYKSYHNGDNKYNFLISLANIIRNDIKICVIQKDLEKIVIYTTCLYKFEWI